MQSAPAHLTRTQRARRDDILQAAISTIAQEGYAAASIDKIAQAARTTKSTVLYHFKSKQAINQAVVGTLFEAGAAYMGPFIVAAHSRPEKLTAYLTANLRYITLHSAHVVAVHQIHQNADITGDTSEPVKWLQTLLAEGQAAGEFGSFDPHVMALAIRSLIDSASFYITEHPELDADNFIREVNQLFTKATTPN